MTIAALRDSWRDKVEGRTFGTCSTMVITEPNDFAAEVHDRMPVVLKEDNFDQ
jgi:putative SOS response-associated peptidase YedK